MKERNQDGKGREGKQSPICSQALATILDGMTRQSMEIADFEGTIEGRK